GYDRGHMCMKQIAWRLGENADWNTHTTLNACPQLHGFNAGIWLNLEERSMRIADRYGRAWIICGPAFKKNSPKTFIGDNNEMKIPVPDYFWKIIAIEPAPNHIELEAYIFPHEEIKTVAKGKYDYTPFLVSVRKIEELTSLNFFSIIDPEIQDKFETVTSKQLPVK
ncbi:MAG: DNA/RNA non-specific endonuclease, partial [Lentisphaeria bacterium]